jgi:hypothetical protein
MSVKLSARMTNSASALLVLEGLTGERGRRIYAAGLNDTGFHGRDRMKEGRRTSSAAPRCSGLRWMI